MNCDISIVMSTYNETEEDLKKSIDSILNQTYKYFEFIIILDNPDNELHKSILKKYECVDNRIKVIINDKNLGLAASLNKGILMSSAKYIARMDADDISEPDRIKKEYKFLEDNPNIDIISTNKVDINEYDDIINVASSLPVNDIKIKKILSIGSIICHSAAMFRRKKIVDIGCYRLFPTSQDYDLWLRASYYNLKFAIIDEKLIKYRIRSNNITNSNPLKQYLIKEYIQKLYKERMKKGEDSFSVDCLKKYLENNKAYDKNQINKFRDALAYIEELKHCFRNKEYLKSLKFLFIILFMQKKSKNVLITNIKSYILKVGN